MKFLFIEQESCKQAPYWVPARPVRAWEYLRSGKVTLSGEQFDKLLQYLTTNPEGSPPLWSSQLYRTSCQSQHPPMHPPTHYAGPPRG